jgi:hypothetical protein
MYFKFKNILVKRLVFICVIQTILVTIFLLSSFATFSQCSINAGSSQFAFEAAYPQVFSGEDLSPCRRELAINIHLVANDSLEYEPSLPMLNFALSKLNEAFKRSGISFRYCKIDSIANYKYDYFQVLTEIDEIKTMNYKAGVINLYIVDFVESAGGFGSMEGHTYFPGGDDIIIIKKEHITTHVLAHQMGHFLGLYHTHEMAFGYERVNGTNCTSAGDLLCDTPADTLVSVNLNCIPEETIRDINGDKHHHPVDNMMSAHINCRCKFTTAQLNKMVYNLMNHRSYLK